MNPSTRRILLRIPLIAALGCFALAIVWLARSRATPEVRARYSATQQLASEAPAEFERALEPREFAFPADHGPHPTFQSEWWYFTGNLSDASGRRFGFEVTFFRRALGRRVRDGGSNWLADEILLAHFALTDVDARTFRSFERSSRAALELAGATSSPFAVWVGPWSARSKGGDFAPLELVARDRGAALDLELDARGTPIANGDRGLSKKGAAPGNASYYYSMPAIAAHGTIELDGKRFDVRGTSWLDREWSTSGLEPGIVGWDWFAIELDDGRALMLYRLREKDGSSSPFSAGTLVETDGRSRALAREDFSIEELAHRRSQKSGANYPSRWKLRVPSAALELEVEPLVDDQELDVSFVYWEGACAVSGSSRGRAYVELVGYADAPVASASASRAAR